MRWMLVCLVLSGVALLGKAQPADAQGAVSAYPWCLERFGSGTRVCYYSTHEQCLYDARPMGGYCVPSPYYRGPAPRNYGRAPGYPGQR